MIRSSVPGFATLNPGYWLRPLVLTVAMLSVIPPATAQQQTTTRLRGTIERIDGSVLTVRAGEAGEVRINLADNARVYGVVKSTLADIKPNAYVGVGAMPQTDGSQKALR